MKSACFAWVAALTLLGFVRFSHSAASTPPASAEPELLLEPSIWLVSETGALKTIGEDLIYTYNNEVEAEAVPPENYTLYAAGSDPASGQLSYYGSDIWTGAGCVTYNLSSNVTASMSTFIFDYGAALSGDEAASASSCSSKACSSPLLVALDPSKYYAFNLTNVGQEPIWLALDYTLYPSNSSVCKASKADTSSGGDELGLTLGAGTFTYPLPTIAYQSFFTSPDPIIIGVLRSPSCVSGLLNASFTDDSASASLALFSQANAVGYAAGADSWSSIASCAVDSSHTDCIFSSASLTGSDWYVAVIFETSTEMASDYSGGFYTATFQGLTPDGDPCPEASTNSGAPAATTFNRPASSSPSESAASPSSQPAAAAESSPSTAAESPPDCGDSDDSDGCDCVECDIISDETNDDIINENIQDNEDAGFEEVEDTLNS